MTSVIGMPTAFEQYAILITNGGAHSLHAVTAVLISLVSRFGFEGDVRLLVVLSLGYI